MKREWKNIAGSGERCCREPGVWVCLSLLLLGWGRAHAEMRVKALGLCHGEAWTRKQKRWGNCRADLSMRGGLGKKNPSIESGRCQGSLPLPGSWVENIKAFWGKKWNPNIMLWEVLETECILPMSCGYPELKEMHIKIMLVLGYMQKQLENHSGHRRAWFS